MNINWFPGHMTKSMRMIESEIKAVDVVIYVLDARAPYSCLNPEFKRIVKGRPVIYVLNKSDLGDAVLIKEWVRALTTETSTAVSSVGTVSGSAASVSAAAKKFCADKLKKYARKGVNASVRAMVIGVPNCGKSTIINCLSRSGKTVTGNRPGVTRGKQWVRVSDNFEVLDTPGTLYPKLSDQAVAKRLAFIGSIRDEIPDSEELATALIRELAELDSKLIDRRYNIEMQDDLTTVLEKIALSKGMLLKGGMPDLSRTASMVIDDFRKGRLGKITLEKASEYDLSII